ncbi:hypothetical protein [Stenotrophomonas pavanii]|nr:hypothetical protein [Stenotrophomonas pavanii]
MKESHDDKQKRQQGYDPSTPRCATCLYFRREPHTIYRMVEKRGRSSKIRIRKEPVRKHAIHNPVVDRCSFGNFITRPQAACDEWRNSEGECIAKAGE